VFKNLKAASHAQDMLKIFRVVHKYTTRKLFLEFRVQKGDKLPVEDFKTSGPSSSNLTDENVEKVYQAIHETQMP